MYPDIDIPLCSLVSCDLLTLVYTPYVASFKMVCALACACSSGEFDSPLRYGPGAALPLGCAACPAPGAAVAAAAWLSALVASPDFSVAAAGGAWCRSSSPCWCGRSGALGFYSMGKLRFCCCVCHRPRAGFGDAAGIGAGRDFLPLWYYLGFPAFCVGRWRWVARRPGGAVAAGRSAISCFSFFMVILI